LDPPIFVVGCSRAGTTLCQSILSRNPDLVGFPESNFLYLVAGDLDTRRFGYERRVRRRRFRRLLRLCNQLGFQVGSSTPIRRRMRRFLKDIGHRDLSHLIPWSLFRIDAIFSSFSEIMNRASGGRRWIEKSPQNIFVLDVISRYLPRTQFVHVIRNERDNIASLWDAGQRYGSFKRRFGGSGGLARAVAFWNRALESSAAWRGRPNHVFLRYEDLCHDPERTVRGLCRAVHVSFIPEMLEYRTEGLVRSAEVWKSSSPEIRQSPSKFGTLFTPEEQDYVVAHSLKADALFPRQLVD
jgi:hypothetical protein